jgi:hypothetical protein
LTEAALSVIAGERYIGDPLQIAIIKKDEEEFRVIYEASILKVFKACLTFITPQLMSSLSKPVALTTSHLDTILVHGSPQALKVRLSLKP